MSVVTSTPTRFTGVYQNSNAASRARTGSPPRSSRYAAQPMNSMMSTAGSRSHTTASPAASSAARNQPTMGG